MSTKEIERLIQKQNKHHSQQAIIEEGRVHDPVMQQIIDASSSNDSLNALRKGEITINEATDEAIQAWLSEVKQTRNKLTLPKVTGVIPKEDL